MRPGANRRDHGPDTGCHDGGSELKHQRRFPESAGTRQDRHFAHRQNGVNVGRVGGLSR